jgi:hypothetical protein
MNNIILILVCDAYYRVNYHTPKTKLILLRLKCDMMMTNKSPQVPLAYRDCLIRASTPPLLPKVMNNSLERGEEGGRGKAGERGREREIQRERERE